MSVDKTYTVHQLAELSGVSVRALHHYDALGLVRAPRGNNGYRRYGRAEIDRLQHVLLYRETGMPLADIKRIFDDSAFDARAALSGHLHTLRVQRARIDGLIASVEKTLAYGEGEEPMKDEEKFEMFKRNMVEDQERDYGAEARARWGDKAVEASKARVLDMSEEQWGGVQNIEERMKEALILGMASGDPTGTDAQRAADLHRQWLCRFWQEGAYTKAAHIGLAEMYVADERFKAYYETIAPGATEFLRDAIRAYATV